MVWLLTCLIVAMLGIARPGAVPPIALAVYIIIPAAAAPEFFADTSSRWLVGMHPAALLVLVSFAGSVVFRLPRMTTAVRNQLPAFVLLYAFVALTILSDLSNAHRSEIPTLITETVGPILFVHLCVASGEPTKVIRRMSLTLVSLAVFESLVAVAVATGFLAQPFLSSLERASAFATLSQSRSYGTMDHPLVLSLLLVASIPLLSELRRATLVVPIFLVIATGTLLTQSRTGVLALLLGTAYLVMVRRTSLVRRVGLLAAASVAILAAADSALVRSLRFRFQADAGSAHARTIARQVAFDQLTSIPLYGGGTGFSYRFARAAGLDTSLENGWLMYAFDYGLLAALVFAAALVALVATNRAAYQNSGAWATVIAAVAASSFSSIATPSACGIVLCSCGAIASLQRQGAKNRPAIAPVQPAQSQNHQPSQPPIGMRN